MIHRLVYKHLARGLVSDVLFISSAVRVVRPIVGSPSVCVSKG